MPTDLILMHAGYHTFRENTYDQVQWKRSAFELFISKIRQVVGSYRRLPLGVREIVAFSQMNCSAQLRRRIPLSAL